jgi:hypothetical protein
MGFLFQRPRPGECVPSHAHVTGILAEPLFR